MDPKDGFVLHVIVNLLYFRRTRCSWPFLDHIDLHLIKIKLFIEIQKKIFFVYNMKHIITTLYVIYMK